MNRIEVLIKADGSLEIKAVGYRGKSCEAATAFLKNVGNITERQHTSDYFLPEEERNVIKNG